MRGVSPSKGWPLCFTSKHSSRGEHAAQSQSTADFRDCRWSRHPFLGQQELGWSVNQREDNFVVPRCRYCPRWHLCHYCWWPRCYLRHNWHFQFCPCRYWVFSGLLLLATHGEARITDGGCTDHHVICDRSSDWIPARQSDYAAPSRCRTCRAAHGHCRPDAHVYGHHADHLVSKNRPLLATVLSKHPRRAVWRCHRDLASDYHRCRCAPCCSWTAISPVQNSLRHFDARRC